MTTSPGSPPLILVVDDNEPARFVRAQTLRREGFRVIEAGNGHEALALSESEDIDLLVCDINLPDLSGLEVAKRAKAVARRPLLQVLHVSQTETTDDAIARGLDTSSDAYLVEPVGAQVLVATARSLLRLRAAEQELLSAVAREAEARRAAEEANRAKDDFLAMLSHELRTPLNTIMGWLWQLRQGPLDPALLKRAVDALHRAAALQAQIIRDLTDVSLIERGRVEIDLSPVDVTAVVAPIVEDLGRRAAVRNVDVVLQASPVTVLADASRLEQIVTNIGNNAVQFTPDGGRITIEVGREDTDAVIRVTDTGSGIDPVFLPHVFERFRQAEAGAERQHAGLGLGLAIVRHLVSLHHGTVRIESEGAGKGTRCTVRIPATTSAVASHPKEPGRALDGYRVLIVEDDPEALELLVRAMRGAGAEVIGASTAGRALELAAAHPFDTIVTDLGLPGLDGIAMLKRLRAAGINAPAIAVTAFATAAERDHALAAGFSTFVSKPASPSTVIRATAYLLKTDKGVRTT